MMMMGNSGKYQRGWIGGRHGYQKVREVNESGSALGISLSFISGRELGAPLPPAETLRIVRVMFKNVLENIRLSL